MSSPFTVDPAPFASALARLPRAMRALVTGLACGLVCVPCAMAQSRGELLYTTHCISCHTTQMHWRENRAANNWASLKVQVQRWQGAASLAWSDGDILDVSRYLNESIYHFRPPQARPPVGCARRSGLLPWCWRFNGQAQRPRPFVGG
jgi:hypothetical protein